MVKVSINNNDIIRYPTLLCSMKSMKNGMTRREALKRMGTVAMSAALAIRADLLPSVN